MKSSFLADGNCIQVRALLRYKTWDCLVFVSVKKDKKTLRLNERLISVKQLKSCGRNTESCKILKYEKYTVIDKHILIPFFRIEKA